MHHGICSCLFCVIHAFPSSEGRMVYRNGSGICNPAISCCLRSYGLEGHSVCSSCAGVYHIAVEASEWREMEACCIVCIKWGDDVPVPLEWLVRILGMCSNFLCFFLEKEPESDRTSGGFPACSSCGEVSGDEWMPGNTAGFCGVFVHSDSADFVCSCQ